MSGEAWNTPCGQCGQPHHARIAADGQRTYRHIDGHAWRTGSDTTLERITRPRDDRYDVMFGQWAFCRRCGGSTSNTTAGKTAHDQLHDELDRLRHEVDRLLGRDAS